MKITLFISLLLTSLLTKIYSQVKWQMNKDTVISWYYSDGDEFNAPTLNINKWEYSYGWSRTIFSNKEQQYYTDGQNHELKEGCLNLFAKREKVEKRAVDWLDDTTTLYKEKANFGQNKRTFDYTSGMIQSHEKFKYGYFEIKFKMPEEKGYWPAFWLYGGEEIDWMELKTEKKNAIHVGRHSKKQEENRMRNYIRKKTWGDWIYFKGNLSCEWNIVSGEWTPDYLKYYLNGECIAYSKLSLNTEKVVCANLAVPGNNGPFKPGPDPSIARSGDFKIDYIRIWSPNPKHEGDAKSETFENSNIKKTGRTKLRSKTRFLYGKRKVHANEGITVTLLPLKNNQFELQVLGKDIPGTANFSILDSDKKIVLTENLKYDSTIIDLNAFQGDNFELKINYLTQTILHKLNKNKN